MIEDGKAFDNDIAKIQQIPITESLLNVICQTTGMGFAAIARVTQTRWITCSVVDKINFGLKPGDELQIENTICNEIREHRQLVVFNDAHADPQYVVHHVPAMYGLRSYISIPIITKSGEFFGTLCAIDPNPKDVNNKTIIDLFTLFTELISFHLDTIDRIKDGETVNTTLKNELALKTDELNESIENLTENDRKLIERDGSILKLNQEIKELAYISSHDLQEPLRKIQMFSKMVLEQEKETLSEKSLHNIQRVIDSAERLQSLIIDLLTFNVNSDNKNSFKVAEVSEIVKEAIADLDDEIKQSKAKIALVGECKARVIPFQIRQVLYNMISNSLKFAQKGLHPDVFIECSSASPRDFGILSQDEKLYCRIAVKDNGIGFDQQFKEKIFEIFQRLNDDRENQGTGIGLSIVKKVMSNHDGYVDAFGKLNEGATFVLYFPCNL